MPLIPISQPWRSQWIGDRLLLSAPNGTGLRMISYTERRRPLAAIDEVLARALVELGLPSQAGGEVISFVTEEGEQAYRIGLRSVIDERRVQLHIGVVLGDDFYTLLVGAADEQDGTFGAAIHELIVLDRLELGLRRRPFQVRAPSGWSSVTRGLVTDWVPPGAEPGELLTVFHAQPRRSPADSLDDMLAAFVASGYAVTTVGPGEPIESIRGLRGFLHEVGGQSGALATTRWVAILADDRYTYPLVLEALERSARQRLDAIVESVVPVPRAPQLAGAATTLGFWIN